MGEPESHALLLTGAPGAGKTTVMRRIAEELRKEKRPLQGFLTEEVRSGRQRVGFRIETLDGRSETLAHVDLSSRFRVGRYGVDVAAVDRIVAATLTDLGDAADDATTLVLIDEIGKMECLSRSFVEAVTDLLDRGCLMVATVALRGRGFIEQVKLRSGVDVWTVTTENRPGRRREGAVGAAGPRGGWSVNRPGRRREGAVGAAGPRGGRSVNRQSMAQEVLAWLAARQPRKQK